MAPQLTAPRSGAELRRASSARRVVSEAPTVGVDLNKVAGLRRCEGELRVQRGHAASRVTGKKWSARYSAIHDPGVVTRNRARDRVGGIRAMSGTQLLDPRLTMIPVATDKKA